MRFIVTNELGKLAKRLRILGFDTITCEAPRSSELIIRALSDERIIVTRSKTIGEKLEKSTVVVTSPELKEQLKQIFGKLNLKIEENKMFTRCTLCNNMLVDVSKNEVKDLVPPRVYEGQEVFKKCPACGKIYWQGTHWGKINAMVNEIMSTDNRVQRTEKK